MNSGSVNIDEGSYHQNWHGFQIVHGTYGDTIYGTGDNDHSVPEDFMHIQLGDNHIHSGAGTNIIIGGGGSNTIYGNGGRDYLDLNSGSSDYGYYNNAFGGSGADVIAFGVSYDLVYGDGGEGGVSSSFWIIFRFIL